MRLKGDEYVSKTIEKMLILTPQISKSRLRRLLRGRPEAGLPAAGAVLIFDAPSCKSTQ